MQINDTFSTKSIYGDGYSHEIMHDPLLYFHSFYEHSKFRIKVDSCSLFRPGHLCILQPDHFCQQAKQLWQGHLKLTPQNPGYMVSLLAEADHLTIQSLEKQAGGTLKVYWVPTTKSSFRPVACDDSEPYSPPHDGESYKWFLKKLHKDNSFSHHMIPKLHSSHQSKRTWNEAYKLCKSAGGYLPIIRSRAEQDGIVRLVRQINPGYYRCFQLSRIFIGLVALKVSLLFTLLATMYTG